MIEEVFRILVVDDSDIAREVAVDYCEDLGMKVTSVSDALEAIERIKTEAFDIVFLDIEMPGISGIDILARIRRVRPGLKVVMCTASKDPELFDACLCDELYGADGFVNKPYDLETFRSCLETVLIRGGKYMSTT